MVIDDLTCPAQGSCVAVGDYPGPSGSQQGLLEYQVGGKWHALQAPIPHGAGHPDPELEVYSVSCSRPGTCVAVGWFMDNNGNPHGVVYTLSKGVWSVVEPPLPRQVDGNPWQLIQVVCFASGSCDAIGGYYDDNGNLQGLVLNGSRGAWQAWTFGWLNSTQVELDALACSSSEKCVITGEYVDQSDLFTVAAAFVGYGGSWKLVNLPEPANADQSATGPQPLYFSDITCPNASHCAAIGTYPTERGILSGLFETMSDGRWSVAAEPPPSGLPVASLYTVACRDAGNCFAIGQAGSQQPQEALLYQLQGTRWSPVQIPLPPDAIPAGPTIGQDGLLALTCVSGSCVAGGYYTDRNSAVQGFALSRSAGAWRPVETPHPAHQGVQPDVFLNQVDCPKVGACAIVGTGGAGAVAETESGGKWHGTKIRAPAGLGAVVGFNAIECPGAGACVAVGYGASNTASANGLPLVMAELDGRWATVIPPLPPDAARGANAAGELYGVSCPAVGACIAVGVYVDRDGNAAGLLLRQTGARWVPTRAPLPPGAGTLNQAVLTLVTCPSKRSCTAVGVRYQPFSFFGEESFVIRWNGSAWTSQAVRLPPDAMPATDDISFLNDLRCPATNSCVGVGTYTNEGGNQQGLMVSISLGAMTPFRVPVDGGDMLAISCPTSTSCVSIGSANGISFLASGSGTSWQLQRLVAPAAAGTPPSVTPTTITCSGGAGCLIVGIYPGSNGNDQSFLTTGQGDFWTSVTAPAPKTTSKATTSIDLYSASCPAARSCLAVGGYQLGSAGSEHGLIEQES